MREGSIELRSVPPKRIHEPLKITYTKISIYGELCFLLLKTGRTINRSSAYEIYVYYTGRQFDEIYVCSSKFGISDYAAVVFTPK